ncbi:MAG: hypothetical protein GY950_14375 [bacterium]|nr:hypothetical protein [bacterium]
MGIKPIRLLFFIAVILWFTTFEGTLPAAPAAPDTPGAAETIKKVRRELNRIKPFNVGFVQQVYSDEQLDIEESGEILFKDDRHLKWTYLDPDYKVFLLQEDQYKFYDRENEQLTVGKIGERSRQWLWQLFFSDDILQYTREDKTRQKIHIKKEDPEEPLDIEIRLNDHFLPMQVIREDAATGARMIFYFKDYKEKVKIPGNAFELKVPEDVEVIDER